MMMNGIDPVLEAQRIEAERKANEKVATVQAVSLQAQLDHYLANHKTKHGKPLREVTKNDYRHHIESELKDWLSKPVATITRDMCLARFNRITARGAKQVANGTFVYLRAVLNAARDRFADEDGNPIVLASNPVTPRAEECQRPAQAEAPHAACAPCCRGLGMVGSAKGESEPPARRRCVQPWIWCSCEC